MASFSRIPNVIMIDMTRLHYPSIAFSSSLVNGDIFQRGIPSPAISLETSKSGPNIHVHVYGMDKKMAANA